MSQSNSSCLKFDAIYLDPVVEHEPLTRRVLQRLSGIPVHRLLPATSSVAAQRSDLENDRYASDPFTAAKRRLLLTRHRGAFMKKCPGTKNLVCCNYYVVNFSSNCPMDCHYCFLQAYLNDPTFTIYANTGDMLEELDAKINAFPQRQFRVGTGEITDSLVLDDLTEYSRLLVPWFARRPNAVLELKTKSICIRNLLDLDPAGRTVVSWSLSPPEMIAEHEAGTADFSSRLAAAVRCQQAGYRLGFHFDPIIHYPQWKDGYRRVVRALHEQVDADKIEWISLGSLRYTAGLKRAIRERFPRSSLLTGESFPAADGKFRYLKHLRVELYRFIVNELRSTWPTIHLYLCMESAEVWKKVFGRQPSCAIQAEAGPTQTALVHFDQEAAGSNGVERFELLQKY